jgi:hypothetical protein
MTACSVAAGTRREFVAGGLSLGALLLAGCGESEPDSPRADGEQGFPVTIAHRHGSTTISEEPRRVVTLGSVDHDPYWRGTPPFGTPWQSMTRVAGRMLGRSRESRASASSSSTG